MQAVYFPARHFRTHYRHELRTLTYVTLDETNGGIIRNLNRSGVAVQAVGALRQQQRVRLHFELRFPRLRVETEGQVSWATASGQCGIRFIDLPARTSRQIDEWIFSNLLDAVARDADHPRPIFAPPVVSIAREENRREEIISEENVPEEDDGLTLSPAPRPVIRLEPDSIARGEASVLRQSVLHQSVLRQQVLQQRSEEEDSADSTVSSYEEPWLAQPLSGRTLARLVDSLIVVAGILLFALIFLSIAHELPPWPLTLGTVSAAAIFVAAAYWAVFEVFGGPSLGVRIAQAASGPQDEGEEERT